MNRPSPSRILSLLAVPVAALVSGCAVRSYALEGERVPLAIPDDVAARFAYEQLTEVKLERLDLDEDVARVFSGSMTIRVADDPEPMLVQFEYWQARSARGRAPAVVITPILGGGRDLALYHCRSFNEAGLHSVLVDRGSKVLRRSWPIDSVERNLRRAVAARRAVVDWLETRTDVDATRLGAFGISMGGILTSVLLAVEPRLTSGVVALAGGDVPSIITKSDEGRLVEWRAAKAEELGIDEAAVEVLLRDTLHSDPARMAPFVDPRRVLFISTRWDTVVPLENQELLWRELGSPLRHDLPAGHYTAIVFLPYVMGLAVEWLEERFKAPPGDT
jgi:hypothetical protein